MPILANGSVNFTHQPRFLFGDNTILFNVHFDSCVETHVEVCHKHQRETTYEKSTPIRKQEFEVRQNQKDRDHIVTKAIFTREEIKELSGDQAPVFSASTHTIVTRLPEYLFMGDSPCNACNRNSQDKKPEYLS